MWARQAIAIAGLTCCVACGFTPRASDPDAPTVIDVGVDQSPELLPRSCKEIHLDPSKLSGSYQIDPDGDGGDAPLTVGCDMTTDDGGWTIVLTAPDNIASAIGYTSATPRLLNDATSTLIAYRDGTQAIVSSFAILALPPDWRVATPFSAANTDLMTSVRIDAGAAAPRTVRYGYQSFANTCDDPWITNETQFGRLCIRGTLAPFYSGFASALIDECSASDGSWNDTPCSSTVKLSIAVR